jgi:hypothetical protein
MIAYRSSAATPLMPAFRAVKFAPAKFTRE